jgi:hypothetical protein
LQPKSTKANLTSTGFKLFIKIQDSHKSPHQFLEFTKSGEVQVGHEYNSTTQGEKSDSVPQLLVTRMQQEQWDLCKRCCEHSDHRKDESPAAAWNSTDVTAIPKE